MPKYPRMKDGRYLVPLNRRPGRPPLRSDKKLKHLIQCAFNVDTFERLREFRKEYKLVSVPEAVRRLVAAGFEARSRGMQISKARTPERDQ